MGIVNELSAIPLFDGLPETYLKELAMIVVDQIFKRGQERARVFTWLFQGG